MSDGNPPSHCARCRAAIPKETADETGGYCQACAGILERAAAQPSLRAGAPAAPATFEDRLEECAGLLCALALLLSLWAGFPAAMLGTALLVRGDDRGFRIVNWAAFLSLLSFVGWKVIVHLATR